MNMEMMLGLECEGEKYWKIEDTVYWQVIMFDQRMIFSCVPTKEELNMVMTGYGYMEDEYEWNELEWEDHWEVFESLMEVGRLTFRQMNVSQEAVHVCWN